MRLWHQDLIPLLSRQQLLGQHHECCAFRGKGWGKKHSVVDYVFLYDPSYLVAYHYRVMDEMEKRGYHPDPIWRNSNWRGNTIGEELGWAGDIASQNIANDFSKPIFIEHNNTYLQECLNNLANKGINIEL